MKTGWPGLSAVTPLLSSSREAIENVLCPTPPNYRWKTSSPEREGTRLVSHSTRTLISCCWPRVCPSSILSLIKSRAGLILPPSDGALWFYPVAVLSNSGKKKNNLREKRFVLVHSLMRRSLLWWGSQGRRAQSSVHSQETERGV